jgi:hypothetical protein
MREWIMMLSPVAPVAYFVVYPEQLGMISEWFARLIH